MSTKLVEKQKNEAVHKSVPMLFIFPFIFSKIVISLISKSSTTVLSPRPASLTQTFPPPLHLSPAGGGGYRGEVYPAALQNYNSPAQRHKGGVDGQKLQEGPRVPERL